jgi:hypothetical protein
MILIYSVRLSNGEVMETKNAAMACYTAIANNSRVKIKHIPDPHFTQSVWYSKIKTPIKAKGR